jgi:hypothetical protein
VTALLDTPADALAGTWPIAAVIDLAEYADLRRNPDKPLQRHKRIRRVSAKRAAENRQRRAMVDDLFKGEQPLCVVWVARQPDWCTAWADDLHEPLTRARGGSITDPDNAVPLCRACHDLITFKPESELEWAYDLGLLVHSWDAEIGTA